MCEPTTIALGMAAMSTVSTISQFRAQQAQADAQVEAQERQADAAVEAALYEQRARRAQQGQDQIATAEEKIRASRAATTAKSKAQAEAASANVAGASVDALLQGFNEEDARYQIALDRQLEFNNPGADLSMEGSSIQLSQTLDQLSTPVATPSYLGAMADIGSGVLGAASYYNANKPPSNGTKASSKPAT